MVNRKRLIGDGRVLPFAGMETRAANLGALRLTPVAIPTPNKHFSPFPTEVVRDSSCRDRRLSAGATTGQSGSEPPQRQPNATVQGGPGGQDRAELPLADQGMVSFMTENIQGKKDSMEIGSNYSMREGNPNLRSCSINVSE